MYSDLIERLRDAGEDCGTNNIFMEAADAIEGLVENVEVMDAILNIFNERENRKKYLKYWRAKNNKSDLSYPDGDEVYREFFELRERVANAMARIEEQAELCKTEYDEYCDDEDYGSMSAYYGAIEILNKELGW